jgi:hypothetical protein
LEHPLDGEIVRLSVSSVHRIWRAFSLPLHRSETFKLSIDPLFVEKVRDIIGLYLNPPDRCSASMKCRRSRHWIAPSGCYPCVRDRPNDARTTTNGTEQPRSLPHWT